MFTPMKMNMIAILHANVLFQSLDKVSMGAKIKNRYNQGPNLTKDTNGSDKLTVGHHKREPRGQPFPSR